MRPGQGYRLATQEVRIRYGRVSDIGSIDNLLRQNRLAFPFVRRVVLEQAARQNQILAAEVDSELVGILRSPLTLEFLVKIVAFLSESGA